MVIHTLPSGTIDLELVEGEVRLQFNAACADALPYCRAACCRSRPQYNVRLERHEAKLFHHQHLNGLPVLLTRGKRCVYLGGDEACLCHDSKPDGCRTFHCSPGGGNGDETVRGRGFALTPVLPQGGT